jgi:hypothetical protein
MMADSEPDGMRQGAGLTAGLGPKEQYPFRINPNFQTDLKLIRSNDGLPLL